MQTIDSFGFSQSIRLEQEFEKALTSLAENPALGSERSDLSPPGRVFRFWPVLKRFVIVYEPSTESIRVARVLDGSRDLPAVLNDDPGEAP